MAAVPICARSGDVIGVIVLHTAAPREFAEEDVELLTHTATLVGGAIEDAQLYDEARERVAALTRLAEVSQQLAAATRHERIHDAATAGARALLHADLCQLFRLESGGHDLRLVASDPPGAPGPRPRDGALLLELLARGRHGGTEPRPVARPRGRGAADARRSSPPTSSSACSSCSRPHRFGPGDEELLRALADQTAMGLERAELIARLTARDQVKDLFDALADGTSDSAVLAAAPAGCDLSRPHVLAARRARGGRQRRRAPTGRRSRPGSPRACAGATRSASSTPPATACARSS